jgi:nucleoside-diphosphate-sugar epimerase
MRPLLAKRGVPVAAGGPLGWIHLQDAVAATVAALEHGHPGQAYNIVDDQPASWREVITAIAAAFGAPRPRMLPGWLFRLAAPYVAAFVVDTAMRVANTKAKNELGWRPTFPTYRDGIDTLARADAVAPPLTTRARCPHPAPYGAPATKRRF